MAYFSDREQVNKEKQQTENISVDVWNGITVLVNSLISNNNLAKDFPSQCPDGNGICGVDAHQFYVSAKSVIPQINFLPEYGNIETLPQNFLDANPFETVSQQEPYSKSEQFKYNVLDFIEFVHKHLCDVQNGQYHAFFHHYELNFLDATTVKDKFIRNINEIFERNNVAFELCVDGQIQRIIDKQLNILVETAMESQDETLNSLLQIATAKIKSPKVEERKIALEKLWDAFERTKTILKPTDKKKSVEELIDKVACDDLRFKNLLESECKTLTETGNNYQIRHFETSKTPISDVGHLDYLFYRMYSILKLLLAKI